MLITPNERKHLPEILKAAINSGNLNPTEKKVAERMLFVLNSRKENS